MRPQLKRQIMHVSSVSYRLHETGNSYEDTRGEVSCMLCRNDVRKAPDERGGFWDSPTLWCHREGFISQADFIKGKESGPHSDPISAKQ